METCMPKTLIMIVGATILAGACATPAAGPEVQSLEVTASRCFGACPAYRYTLSRTGAVVFHGESDTAVQGEHQRRVEPQAVMAVFAQLEPWRQKADRGFAFRCDQRITDQPTYRVRWIKSGGAASDLTYDRGCLSVEGRAFAQTVTDLPDRLGLSGVIGAPRR